MSKSRGEWRHSVLNSISTGEKTSWSVLGSFRTPSSYGKSSLLFSNQKFIKMILLKILSFGVPTNIFNNMFIPKNPHNGNENRLCLLLSKVCSFYVSGRDTVKWESHFYKHLSTSILHPLCHRRTESSRAPSLELRITDRLTGTSPTNLRDSETNKNFTRTIIGES